MSGHGERSRKNESKPIMNDHSANGSASASPRQSPAEKNGDFSPHEPPGADASSISLVPTATGPRTPQGKERSKHNAIKHGIFSKALLLKNESRGEYNSLLAALVEHFQPHAAMEELLVEKLAMLVWRHRRLVAAETAEIRTSTEFLEWDETNKQEQGADEIPLPSFGFEQGLISRRQNPAVLERCLQLLAELREGYENEGFGYDRAGEILTRLYGDADVERLQETLLDSYQAWESTSETSEEERKLKGYATPAECAERVQQEIDNEIRRLKSYQRARAFIESERTKLEILRRGVPDAIRLDRLLRYEASLERAFDRALSQLERLQRMRTGQPVPPPIQVALSS